MVKKKLLALIDVKLIVIIVVIMALCVIFTMLLSDKVTDFEKQYKKKFYGYILSFVLLYALVAFLGHNKLFEEITNEFLFYQIASLIFGILHVWFYRWYFQEFSIYSYTAELLFSLVVPLYSSVLFIIIYTALNGIDFTFLMCSHFLVFVIPTGFYMTFNIMMIIPPRKFVTWTPLREYEAMETKEMADILLITLLIKKDEKDKKYSTIRVKAPVKVDFGRLFIISLLGYNRVNDGDIVQLEMPNGEPYNWVFYLQPKWYEKTKYVDANYYMGLNGITENSVIICQRETEKNVASEEKKKPDEKLYGVESHNEAAKAMQIESVEKSKATSSKIE